ncbi:MAG TPA: DUF2277 domain-containing protein [Actinomycetota bacterium]
MCRSIKRLREGAEVVPDDEIRAAALQYVRKVSGFREPTARHREAFEDAVDRVAVASKELLDAVAQELAR